MKRYRLMRHSSNHTKPYYIAMYVQEGRFWQQISPSYMYQYSAINFAKRHNITLENP